MPSFSTPATRHHQQGLGLIGWLLALTIFGLLFIFGLRLFPLYYDYFAVRDIVRDVAHEFRDVHVTQPQVWRSVEKRLNVNGIDYIEPGDLKLIRGRDGQTIQLNYEARSPYLWNIDLIAKFKIEER